MYTIQIKKDNLITEQKLSVKDLEDFLRKNHLSFYRDDFLIVKNNVPFIFQLKNSSCTYILHSQNVGDKFKFFNKLDTAIKQFNNNDYTTIINNVAECFLDDGRYADILQANFDSDYIKLDIIKKIKTVTVFNVHAEDYLSSDTYYYVLEPGSNLYNNILNSPEFRFFVYN